ncbi:MAG: hypothetical protein ACI3W5_02705, partial [Faecousia sp.]
ARLEPAGSLFSGEALTLTLFFMLTDRKPRRTRKEKKRMRKLIDNGTTPPARPPYTARNAGKRGGIPEPPHCKRMKICLLYDGFFSFAVVRQFI